jgi:hypothetical protein
MNEKEIKEKEEKEEMEMELDFEEIEEQSKQAVSRPKNKWY